MPDRRHSGLGPPVWLALAAFMLALAAGLWLAFWPGFYQGVSATSTPGDGAVQRSVSNSLVAENGAWVLGLLAVPLILTGLGLLGATKRYRLFVWGAVVVLFAFCVISAFTIGLWYVPSAITLVVAVALQYSHGATRRG